MKSKSKSKSPSRHQIDSSHAVGLLTETSLQLLLSILSPMRNHLDAGVTFNGQSEELTPASAQITYPDRRLKIIGIIL